MNCFYCSSIGIAPAFVHLDLTLKLQYIVVLLTRKLVCIIISLFIHKQIM